MYDFTIAIYIKLIQSFLEGGYYCLTFKEFIQKSLNDKMVVLKHDVDRLPKNALQMAKIENRLGIKSSYYFRMVKTSYDEDVIRQIRDMGHEVGYHYENLSEISKEQRAKSKEELFELAIDDFRLNLEKLRKFYPVKTICMHGSPLSRYDNKEIWERYDYRDFGLIADPYFDINFDEVFYLTDTGRSWNNSNVSIRDRVNSKFDIKIKNTHHLIEKIQNDELPNKVMINVHPQRWNDHGFCWYKELIWQNIKNVVKRYLIKLRD